MVCILSNLVLLELGPHSKTKRSIDPTWETKAKANEVNCKAKASNSEGRKAKVGGQVSYFSQVSLGGKKKRTDKVEQKKGREDDGIWDVGWLTEYLFFCNFFFLFLLLFLPLFLLPLPSFLPFSSTSSSSTPLLSTRFTRSSFIPIPNLSSSLHSTPSKSSTRPFISHTHPSLVASKLVFLSRIDTPLPFSLTLSSPGNTPPYSLSRPFRPTSSRSSSPPQHPTGRASQPRYILHEHDIELAFLQYVVRQISISIPSISLSLSLSPPFVLALVSVPFALFSFFLLSNTIHSKSKPKNQRPFYYFFMHFFFFGAH